MTVTEAIKRKASELAHGTVSDSEISERICQFVREEVPYALEEWNVGADETLHLRQGMCAGKAQLAVTLHRATGIKAQFKVLRIVPEEGLLEFIARRLEETTNSEGSPEQNEKSIRAIRSLPSQRDHIVTQVSLGGQWRDVDVARDPGLDAGMRFMGLWQERRVVSEEGPFDSLNPWIERRMERISVAEDRRRFFDVINEQIEQIRKIGNIVIGAGIRPWTYAEVAGAVRDWDIPCGCPFVPGSEDMALDEIAQKSKEVLTTLTEPTMTNRQEQLLDWLYALVRHNIKRGRVWELSDVLSQRRADCLGYARILTVLAAHFGIDAGVVEVVQDNRGSYVPHYVCLVNLSGKKRRLIDPWYGSANICHRLLTARVKEGASWATRQVSMETLQAHPSVSGLSREQVCGISLYILGNSHLNQANDDDALRCYNSSLWLFPYNSRTLFNRAIVLERLGEPNKAHADYQQAMSSDPSIARVLATTEDIEQLIDLDEKGVCEPKQSVYLMRKGFVTGEEEAWERIAQTLGYTVSQVQENYRSTERVLAQES